MRISAHKVPDGELEALIFDVDGTLVDTMPHHYESWHRACTIHNLTFTEAQFYAMAGRTLPDTIIDLVKEQHGTVPTTEFIEKFLVDKNAAHEAIGEEKGSPKSIDCVVEIARNMKAKGIKLAAASSGLRHHVIESLKVNNLLELFDENHIVVGADLPPGRGKPEPDIFLEAAKRLGVSPDKCRAYEDGESGLQASNAAGMEVIDVRELPGYPLVEALKEQLPHFKANRPWLK